MIRKTIKGGDFKPQMVGELEFDQVPEEGSFNPVTSDGVKNSIDDSVGAAKAEMQEKIDEVTLDPSAVALGNVHLLDEVTEFPADGCILIDSETNGARKMSKDKLLELTAQNALAGNVAPAFDPTRTSENPYKAGESVVYLGESYSFTDNHYGSWTGSDVTKVPLCKSFESVCNVVSSFFEESVNIFNGIDDSLHGYYQLDGNFASNDSYRVTKPVLLSPNTEYKATHRSELGANNVVVICNLNGDIVDVVIAVNSNNIITFTNDKPYYVLARFNYGYASNPNFFVSKSSLFTGSYVYPEGWKTRISLNANKLIGRVPVATLPSEIVQNGVVIKHSANIYNNNDLSQCISNKYVDLYGYSDGTNYQISQPIYVEGGVTYKCRHSNSYYTNNFYYALLNDDFSYKTTASGTNDNGDNSYMVFTPASSGYIRINLGVGDLSTIASTFVLSKYDEYQNTYTPYSRSIEDDIGLGDLQIEQVLNIAAAPSLAGKKISLNGDSICYGEGYAGGYGKIIADAFGMEYENIARSGATIQAETYSAGGSPRHWICRTISNMSQDADYIILEGGVNDVVGSSMGSLTSDYDGALDDTTFYGAFESMLKQALIRFPGKKIGYIAVHKMDNFDSLNTTSMSKYLAAKLCCEKWGVPFLDLNVTVPPFARFPESGDLYTNLRAAYTYNADGWHPNEQGYKKYYVPKIVAWMNSL